MLLKVSVTRDEYNELRELGYGDAIGGVHVLIDRHIASPKVTTVALGEETVDRLLEAFIESDLSITQIVNSIVEHAVNVVELTKANRSCW